MCGHLISLEPKIPVATCYLHRDCLESAPFYTARFCKRILYNPHRHPAISTFSPPSPSSTLPSPTPFQLHLTYPKHYIKTSRAFSALHFCPHSPALDEKRNQQRIAAILLLLPLLTVHPHQLHTRTTRNHDCPATPRRPHRDPS